MDTPEVKTSQLILHGAFGKPFKPNHWLAWGIILSSCVSVRVSSQTIRPTVVEGVDGGSVTLPCGIQSKGDLVWKQGLQLIVTKRAEGEVILSEGPYNGDVSLVNGADLRISPLKRIRDGNTGTRNKNFTCQDTGRNWFLGIGLQRIELRLLNRITGVSIPEASDGRVTVRAGRPKTLTCSVTGYSNPPPSYSWSVDDGPVSGQTQSSYTFIPKKSTKSIKCTATNAYSNGSVLSVKEATATLNVQYLDYRFDIFRRKYKNLKVIESDQVTLQCRVDGNPTPNYEWRMSGSSEVRSTSADYTIENVQRSAAGVYKCTYSNTIGSSSIKANMIVHYPPDVTVVYDKVTQTLTCRAEGLPDAYNFTEWEHQLDGKLLQTLGTQSSESTSTLKLPSTLTFEDTGYYVCQVSNGIKSLQKGQVFVTPQSPPLFQNQSATLTLIKGEAQNISVPFYTKSDTPNVRVAWDKPEKALNKSGETTVLTSYREERGQVRLMIRGQSVSIEGTVTVLTLRDVAPSDEGNYTVTVTNVINGGSQSKQITISVLISSRKQGQEERTGNVGAAVGGGIAALAAAIFIVILAILLIRKHRMKRTEEIRHPENQTVNFQNDRQEGGFYQGLTVNPDYVNTTDNQPYATLGEKDSGTTYYKQRDVTVKKGKHIVRDSVSTLPQYEDMSFSTEEGNPDYIEVCAGDSEYENKTFPQEASTNYYNL